MGFGSTVIISKWHILKGRKMWVLIFLAGLLSNKLYCVALGTVLAIEVN